jgi:putative oxidoreductase
MSEIRNSSTALNMALLGIRLIAGTIFVAHGAQKLFGTFGGPGLEAFAADLGPIAYPVAIGEFFGGLGLLVGLLSRFSAAANIVIMIGAIVMVHGSNGFFSQAGGFEYNLALIGLLIPTLLVGPGRYSLIEAVPLLRRQPTVPKAVAA